MKAILMPIIMLLLVLAAIGGTAFLVQGNSTVEKLSAYAQAVVRACASDEYPPACYDKEIPRLLDRGLTMEEAFEVTRLVQQKTGGYFYCHVLGHELAAKETAKDPSAWTEVVARCPSGMCSNGCIHGAAQERFRTDEISDEAIREHLPTLSTVCERKSGGDSTELERASCYHSVGHLAMYLSGGDVPVAGDVCERVARKPDADYSITCFEGVYMQVFQPLEPEDIALVRHIPASTPDAAVRYCDGFTGERKAACHRESWPLFTGAIDMPGQLEVFCSRASDSELTWGTKGYCYNAMFYVMASQLEYDVDRIAAFCDTVPEYVRGQCYANSASRFIETDYRLARDAVALCTIASQKGYEEICYHELLYYSTFNFNLGSPEFDRYCRVLPEPFQARCLAGEGKNLEWGQYW